jgi:predicted homoserine dehydrogenase-like protein
MIGAGKFGSMFFAQVRRTPGIHLVAVADLDVERARANLKKTGWDSTQFGASTVAEAHKTGATNVTDDALAMVGFGGLDIVIEATGDPAVGIRHCLAAIDAGHHIISVNVEADVLAGPLLVARAQQAGLIYSLAYGDQPALICEHVDWARACGFTVVCAGKGTRYHPSFHASTPDTVWPNFGITPEMAVRGGMNPKMFNSFIDGTKSGIEMTAVCNATGLTPQPGGLNFPPASCYQLAEICKPKAAGGTLSHLGTTEVVSSINRDMTPIEHHLQVGTYVVVEAGHEYVRHTTEEYGFLSDSTHNYMTLYRPVHIIGMELGISVASIALRGEPTGVATGFRSDVVATAKRALKAGEILDGEGGYCVWGKQVPAEVSLELGGLPLGLTQNVKLVNDIDEGGGLTWADVEIDETDQAVRLRREMEAAFGRRQRAAAAE